MKMRNPNGYGSVIRLRGKRRKPFAVRITTHWDSNGKQQYKYLGYYKTQKEANQQLFYYNEHPYNIDVQSITFAEVYEKWKKEKF
jgi:site-specific recombinase, phage integrase family